MLEIKMKHLAHFLLVFIASAGEIGSNPTINSTCPVQNIKKRKWKIEETPINFRNSSGVRENERQMLIKLKVSKDVKNCMDNNKFNLKINLDKPISESDVRVGSTATQHIVNVKSNYVEIESCNFDDQEVSDEQLILLNLLDSESGESNDGTFKKFICFLAPPILWELKKNIKNMMMTFEGENQKMPCKIYRRCFQNLMHYFTRYDK